MMHIFLNVWYGFLDVTTILFYVVLIWEWAKLIHKTWVNLTRITNRIAP